METKILFINTNIGKIESSMSFEDAYNEIETAKKEGRLAKIIKPQNIASLGEGLTCNNNAVEYIDINEVKVFSYVDNTLEPIGEKKTSEKTK